MDKKSTKIPPARRPSVMKAPPAPRRPDARPQEEAGRSFRPLRAAAIVFLFFFLVAAAVGAGLYFKVLDKDQLAKDLELYKYPIVGRYFPQPAAPAEPAREEQTAADAARPAAAQSPPAAPAMTQAQLAGRVKEMQAEENKRISRLARAYGAMKPAQAVAVLNQLDDILVLKILSKMDDDQVAAILAAFDAGRSARLTEGMYSGKGQAAPLPVPPPDGGQGR